MKNQIMTFALVSLLAISAFANNRGSSTGDTAGSATGNTSGNATGTTFGQSDGLQTSDTTVRTKKMKRQDKVNRPYGSSSSSSGSTSSQSTSRGSSGVYTGTSTSTDMGTSPGTGPTGSTRGNLPGSSGTLNSPVDGSSMDSGSGTMDDTDPLGTRERKSNADVDGSEI